MANSAFSLMVALQKLGVRRTNLGKFPIAGTSPTTLAAGLAALNAAYPAGSNIGCVAVVQYYANGVSGTLLSLTLIATTLAGGAVWFDPTNSAFTGGTTPATITSANAAQVNGNTLNLAAGSTLTIDSSAWPFLSLGLILQVAQTGTATLAFSGTATKENAAGVSAASVTLAASGEYVLTQSPTGSAVFRLSGGGSI